MFDQLASYLARYGPLSDRDFRSFVSALQRRRVRRKQNLIAPGEAGSFDMFVESGCLRIYSIMRDGAEHILDFGTENTWWCGSLLCGAYPLQNIGIDAVERTDVLLIDSSNKERLCGDVPDVERMFRFLAQSNLTTRSDGSTLISRSAFPAIPWPRISASARSFSASSATGRGDVDRHSESRNTRSAVFCARVSAS